jgi:hypothetical protein
VSILAAVYFVTWLFCWLVLYREIAPYDVFDLPMFVFSGFFGLFVAGILLGLIGVGLFLGAVAIGVVK